MWIRSSSLAWAVVVVVGCVLSVLLWELGLLVCTSRIACDVPGGREERV
jgi:hypothetical protein